MKKILGILLIFLALLMTVGAGAHFRYYVSTRTLSYKVVPDDDELIALKALQPYVTYNDGQIYVDITQYNLNKPSYGGSGMSPDSVYVFEEMFEVINNLWENENSSYPICVTIMTQNKGVLLFAGSVDDPIAGPAHNIQFTVIKNKPVKVGMIFNNYNSTLGSYQLSMSVSAEKGECRGR